MPKEQNMSEATRLQAQTYFDALWSKESKNLVGGGIKPAEMKDGATVPIDYCVSTIGRVISQDGGRQVAHKVNNLLAVLENNSPAQFVYPPDSMHISMIGCTPRKESMNAFPPEQITKIRQICEESLSSVHPAEISFTGLGITGNQVFLQGYPHDRNWESARKVIDTNLSVKGEQPISYPDKFPIHLNIARITDASDQQIAGIRNFIEQNRTIEIGTLLFDHIELVITDFVLSKNNFQSLHTYNLR